MVLEDCRAFRTWKRFRRDSTFVFPSLFYKRLTKIEEVIDNEQMIGENIRPLEESKAVAMISSVRGGFVGKHCRLAAPLEVYSSLNP